MPKRPTDKKGFPRKPEDCFASRHLSASDFKVYNVIVACAVAGREDREGKGSTGKLIFNASIRPWLCNAVPVSDSYAREILSRLEEQGWLRMINDWPDSFVPTNRPRYKDGRGNHQAPNIYEVVTHEDFVAAHPNSCPPNEYAPDGKTAEAYGLRYGAKFGERQEMPINFRRSLLAAILRRIKPTDLTGNEDLTRPEDIALGKAIEEIGEEGIRAAFEEAVIGVPVTAKPISEVRLETGIPVTARYRSSGRAVTGVQAEPLPEVNPARDRRSGEYPSTAFGTSSVNTHTHESGQDEAAECVCVLLQEATKSIGRDWGITDDQRRRMEKLAQRDGRNFLRAGRAFLKHPPDKLNNRTTDPWLLFLAGFEKYLLLADEDDAEAARQEAERPKIERAAMLDGRRKSIRLEGLHLKEEFLASLTDADREYIAKVEAANQVEELPEDNHRDFSEELQAFRKAEHEKDQQGPGPESFLDS